MYLPATDRAVSKKLHAYFGKHIPSLQIRAPHIPSLLTGGGSEETDSLSSSKGQSEGKHTMVINADET